MSQLLAECVISLLQMSDPTRLGMLADAGVGPGVAIAPVDTEHLRRVRAQMPSLRHRQPALL